MEKQNLKSTISFRITPDESEKIREIANVQNRLISDFLREIIRDQVISKQPVFVAKT